MTTVNGTSAPVYDGIREGAAELALRRHGWTGERLMKEARRIVADYIRGNVPYLVSHRRDELVDFVTEKALMAAMRFDPDHITKSYGSQGGKHFDSYICDVMWNRCTDWQRSKAEGNGDRRYNNDGRVALVGDVIEELAAERNDEEWLEPTPSVDRPRARWKEAAGLIDEDFAEWHLVNERRMLRWISASEMTGLTFQEWVVTTLDLASDHLLPKVAA